MTIRHLLVSRPLLIFNLAAAMVYFSWWLRLSNIGNPLLYLLLLLGEVYHVGTAMMLWFTLWPAQTGAKTWGSQPFAPAVDVFITVAGEPVEVVKETVLAARQMSYPKQRVYVLNDGLVAKKDNWQEMIELAKDLKVECITRTVPGGAKAGNINNALKQTKGEIVAIFDADMVPHPDFLQKVTPLFQDPKIGFVQTPQYYKNFAANTITRAAWEQQELFFGPVMRGKEKSNAGFICGTNVAIRRQALLEAGGMNEGNIAEDFVTSLAIHSRGWRSYYLGEVLAEGLAPQDLLSYYKQQMRWARGSLEVLLHNNPLWQRLSWPQKIEYLSSAVYYLNGAVVMVDAVIPLTFLFFGIETVAATTTSFALYFTPFIFLNMYTLYKSSGNSFTFRALSFSQSSFLLQLLALKSILLGQKMGFFITPKKAQSGNFLSLAYPHMLYVLLFFFSCLVALVREGVNPSVVTNIAWGLFNVVMFLPYIQAAIYR